MNQQDKKPEGSDNEQVDQNETTKKLSKGQKKKLRQLKKKQEEKNKLEEAQKAQGEQKVEQKPQQAKTQAATEEKTEAKEDKKQQKKEEKKEEKKKKGGKVNVMAALAKKRMEDLQKFEQEKERQRKQRQAEQQRLRKEQQQRKRKEQEEKDRIKRQQEERIKKLKKQGLYLTKKQQQKRDRQLAQLQQVKQTNEKTELAKQGKFEEEEPAKEKTAEQLKREQQKKQKLRKKEEKLLKDKKADFQFTVGKYRSPVCCILGHVDTGKTTLLDKIRRTNVQEGEAGGITQQIGATFFPQQKLIEEVNKCKGNLDVEVEVPGLLIIDTPGHESFSNLRSRGSSLCDIAILVIDLQHGLEKQTLESLELLKKGGTPFVVALNKIDRSYNWKAINDSSSFQSLKTQSQESVHDYKTKLQKVTLQLNEKGYNAAVYWQNEDPDEYISLVPTSGITGEGIPDLLSLIVQTCLTNQSIQSRITIKKNVFKCTVMQVKMIEGYGTTIDCLLVDGIMNKEDQIVLLGFEGPIVTKVKALLTPHPMKEMRIKDEYIHHDTIFAANGVKIAANGLDKAVAGSPLIVANTAEEVEEAIAICKNELTNIQKKFALKDMGVGVSASTLGSLEALLEYLKSQSIPVSHISVGPVSKQDVIKAMKSLLSEVPERRKEQYACLLVFDVKVLADAQKFAEQNGIKIFTANIIYHLTKFFNDHVAAVKQERREREGKQAVFPCILKQVATFRKSDPIVLGVDVEEGVLKIGTPICIYKQGQKNGDKQIRIGVIESIQHNHKKLTEARKKNGSVAISLGGEPNIMSGRHFEQKDMLASVLTRRSIDCLKEHFKQQVPQQDWHLVIKLKKYFNVA